MLGLRTMGKQTCLDSLKWNEKPFKYKSPDKTREKNKSTIAVGIKSFTKSTKIVYCVFIFCVNIVSVFSVWLFIHQFFTI